jgi:hypothetical protein
MQGSTPSSSTMQVTSEWNDHVGMMNVHHEQVTALTRIVNMFTSDEKGTSTHMVDSSPLQQSKHQHNQPSDN